ncbi:hypothetical protein Q3G72_013439 [Acer saccharum]|nr:hypothetical protein Q3G72_013439 [Acer saccharum]
MATTTAAADGARVNKDKKMASAEQLVLDLSNPKVRENALLELSKGNCSNSSDLIDRKAVFGGFMLNSFMRQGILQLIKSLTM